MSAYILGRLAQIPIVLIGVSVVLFMIMHYLPGDPIYAAIGESESVLEPEVVEQMRDELGLNDPVFVQYGRWVGGLAKGDLGTSFRFRGPVSDEIAGRVLPTLQLGIAALLVGILVGVPSGTLAAVKRGSIVDVGVTLVAMFGVAIPNFWFSMLLIWVFVVSLGVLPATGWVGIWEDPVAAIKHMVLPVAALGLTLSGSIMRYTRSSVLETLSQDYIRTARAKGLPERAVVVRHALRNGLLAVVTIIGLQLGQLLAGSIIIESMFVIPGIGRLGYESISSRDYPTLQGVVLVFTFSVLIVNLATDVLYAMLDPRVKYA